MREYLDEKDKIGEIILAHGHPNNKNKLYIVVEGDSDVKLFRSLFNCDFVFVESSTSGKVGVEKIVKSVKKEGCDRVIGVRDCDFEKIFNRNHELDSHSIFMTDFHDIEVMMMKSPAWQSFINEYSSSTMLNEVAEKLLSLVFEVAYIVGIFRLINEMENLELNFKAVSLSRIVKFNCFSYSFNTELLIKQLIEASGIKESHVNSDYLKIKYNEVVSQNHDSAHVCCGHDISILIAEFYGQSMMRFNRKRISSETVESSLRISYGINSFRTTRLYQMIENKIQELESVQNHCWCD